MRAYTRVSLLIAASAGLAMAHASAQSAAPAAAVTPATPAAAPATPAAAAAAAAAPATDAVTATLAVVRELRELDLRPKNDDGMVMSSGDGPGMRLSFSLSLAAGAKVSQITQPKKLVATDNKGTDLSKIEPGFNDEIEWLSIEQWFDNAPTLEVKLTSPSRVAETFSVAFDTEITTYSGVEHVDMELVRKWTPLTHRSLAAIKAEYRITSRGNFEVRPVAARELIEGVIALGEEDVADSPGHSVQWDDKTAEFSVDPAPEEGQKLRVWVRADVKTVPVHVELKDQKLP